MLKRIHLTDFKSFVDEEIDLAPLTLLVGANASGKSNFLDALWLLHGLALNLSLGEVLDGEEPSRRNGEPWPGLRGGSTEASRLGKSGFEIESTWGRLGNLPAGGRDVIHRIRCQTSPKPRVVAEYFDFEDRGSSRDRAAGGSPFSVLHQLHSGPEGHVQETALALRTMHLLTIRPERMRDYGHIKRPRLGPDGTNFSGALYHLCEDPGERQDLVDWLTEMLAPEVAGIDFVKVEELGDVMAMFVENGQRVSARSLSDGTLRFLGLLLSLRTAERGSTILIEEIGSGLHPARIHVLMELLADVTRESELQIIATTHAPAILQSLDNEALRHVVVFGRTDDQQTTLIRRLGDLPHFNDVVKRKDIGELFATGWLEMAL